LDESARRLVSVNGWGVAIERGDYGGLCQGRGHRVIAPGVLANCGGEVRAEVCRNGGSQFGGRLAVPPDRLRATKFDQWTAVEIIGHLADAAEIFADRVQRCVDEEKPQVASYDQDAMAAERRNDVRDPMDLSRRLSAAHSRIIHLLQRPGVAARPAVHSAWGQVDAGHFGAYQADHSHGHTSELSAAFPPTV